MDTMKAFAMGEAARARGDRTRIFDWDKAAQLIRDSGCSWAAAGLGGDWEHTGGCIFRDGEPVTDGYTYLASCWAIPEIEIGEIGGDVVECWRWQEETPGWDSNTKWPDSALKILDEGE